MSEKNLDGRVALISGGAGGIGQATAIQLAKNGARVVITGRFGGATSDEMLNDKNKTIAQIRSLGGECIAVRADVRSYSDMCAAVATVIEKFGRLDIVVANAGIFSGGVVSHQLDEDDWRSMMDVNVTGAWNTAKAALPELLRVGGGSIVLVSSVAGIKGGSPGFSHYVTAKHALTGLGRALATEYGPANVRVNCVAPTSVVTPMSQCQYYYDLFNGGPGGTREKTEEVIKSMHSLPVGAIPAEDVANAIAWLVSDASRYVHGIVLPVDAGASMY